MLTYSLRRLLFSIPVLVIASFLAYAGVRAAFPPTPPPGLRDPQAWIREKRRLGLDRPLIVQWGKWFGRLLHGDWGHSDKASRDIFPLITRALGFTVQIIFWGVLFAALIAIGVGVYSAVRQYSFFDYGFTGTSYVLLAMPPFFFGLLCIQFLSVWPKQHFNLAHPIFFFIGLHGTGMKGINLDYFRHLALPVLTLVVQLVASWSRFERASMLDVLGADYVRTARAKGVPARTVIFKHAFRNALIPLVTVMALDSGLLFGGLVITEQIFSIPGMGRLFINSLAVGDAPTLAVWVVVVAGFVIVFNLLADLLYGWLDPRIRLS